MATTLTFPIFSGAEETGTAGYAMTRTGNLPGLPVMIWLPVAMALWRALRVAPDAFGVAGLCGGRHVDVGRGRIFGTIIGAFVTGSLSDGLIKMGVSSFAQTMIKGVLIVLAMAIEQAESRLQARVALAQEAVTSR